MARSQWSSAFILLLSIFCLQFGKCVQVILGDEFTFLKNACRSAEGKLVKRTGQDSTREVAVLSGGVWRPADYYRDRVSQNSTTVHFNRTVFTDTGAYELTCGSREEVMQLEVVVPYEPSVEEGGTATLKCYFDGTDVKYVRWTKHEEIVFERHFSSGVNKYGTGYDEGKVSLSSDDYEEGNMSLILKRAQTKDGGDYFCFVHTADEVRHNAFVAAVRLTVKKNETPNAATQPPTHPPCEETPLGTWTIIIIITIIITAFVTLGITAFFWWMKSRCSSGPGDTGAARTEEVTEPLNTQSPPPPPPPPPQVNGCPLSNSHDAQSSV